MTTTVEHAREAIRRFRELREANKAEAVLRSEFISRLRLIFPAPEDNAWINHYSEGAEAATKIGLASGETANRFIDNLVGSTTIEYEPDLRPTTKFDQGFAQVAEHVCGLIRNGVPVSQIRGILSDTVLWYAYDVEIAPDTDPLSCTTADVALKQIDKLELSSDDEVTAKRLIGFVRKHLAREQSRPLLSEFLTIDLGLDSTACKRSISDLRALVQQRRKIDPSISLATDLWSRFVDHLEMQSGSFRTDAYVDELYLCILARILTANVLHGQARISNPSELKAILDGTYFSQNFQLANVVERDYFGWLTNPDYIDEVVQIAAPIQRDLYAYDYSWRPEEDLFGRIMAQLARRTQRQLLGQEWTPAWLGRLLADRCLANIPEGELPRVVDMCCGSGSIIAEVLKTAKVRFSLTDISELQEVATGFDIDPLAVSLSKTTWVVALADEIKSGTSPIVIPIFHADSLFAVTPVTAQLPFQDGTDTIELSIDGATLSIPAFLIEPTFRELFDRIVDWSYDEAIESQTTGHNHHLSEHAAAEFVKGAATACNLTLDSTQESALIQAVHAVVRRMTELSIAGRNGIWAFILRNTYRPGLLSGQFNGLVSNPPWLALSALADNPYKDVLTHRAKLYGMIPPGQSFLHLELGTTHLLHAVDRYLSVNASIACLVPGTIFNGHHHEPFRQRTFLTGDRPVPLEILQAWQIQPGTFKYPGAAVIAHKVSEPTNLADTNIVGYVARKTGLEQVEFSTTTLGQARTAWLLEKQGHPAALATDAPIPAQGADLMPRTAVCVEILKDAGTEYRVDTPSSQSKWAFAVKAAKILKGKRFAGYVAPRFIHRMAQSENLLPFALGDRLTPIAIPAYRDNSGAWRFYDEAQIRGMGFIETARRFRAINEKLAAVGKGTTLQQRIDVRFKLSKQHLGDSGFLVLAGAGGKYICAACIALTAVPDLVIDQTLYWQVVSDEQHAWFLTGMLNTNAMTQAILPFNPKGAFGERHIHALPYRLMPRFDVANEDHARIAVLAMQIAAQAKSLIATDVYLRDPNKSLQVRRRKLRKLLHSTEEFSELDTLSAAILGTTIPATTD